jgi:hypothetical protein
MTSKRVVLRGDKQCPHGHTARKKCNSCDREDDQAEIERLRAKLKIQDDANDILTRHANDILTRRASETVAWLVKVDGKTIGLFWHGDLAREAAAPITGAVVVPLYEH